MFVRCLLCKKEILKKRQKRGIVRFMSAAAVGGELPLRYAVSCLIYKPGDETTEDVARRNFVIVQRPATDPDLPNVWGLPAGMHAEGSSWTESITQAGVKKLGVHTLHPCDMIAEGIKNRGTYTLLMRQYICRLTADTHEGMACPQEAFPEVTQYQQWRYGTLEDLQEAADRGSLCSQLYTAFVSRCCECKLRIDHAVLIPGNGCGDELDDCMWYPWLAHKLLHRGVTISLRGFPDHLFAHEDIWKAFVVDELKLTSQTLVIGHSSGAACSLRLMEEHTFAACVLVSAYDDDMGDDLERESGYFSRSFDYSRMTQHVKFVLQFHSQSDHLVPVAIARRVATGLRKAAKTAATEEATGGCVVEYIETADDGHFQDDSYEHIIWKGLVDFDLVA